MNINKIKRKGMKLLIAKTLQNGVQASTRVLNMKTIFSHEKINKTNCMKSNCKMKFKIPTNTLLSSSSS